MIETKFQCEDDAAELRTGSVRLSLLVENLISHAIFAKTFN